MESSIGGRLRQAIQRMPREGKRRGVRFFAAKMEERHPNVIGISYPSIHSYLADRSTPSQEFLEAAADVLGVPAEWLAREEGQPTEKDRVVVEEAGVFQTPLGDAVWSGFVDECGFTPPETLRPLVLLLWRTRERAYAAQVGSARHFHPDTPRQVAVALLAPLRALGLDAAMFAGDALEGFFLAMAPGAAAALDHVREPTGREN